MHYKRKNEAQRIAARHNNKVARELPLFAQAGILEQVAPTVTAEQVETKRAAQAARQAAGKLYMLERGLRSALARFQQAKAAGVDLDATWQSYGMRPYSSEYIADFWHQAARKATR